jgi:hypothetical protein
MLILILIFSGVVMVFCCVHLFWDYNAVLTSQYAIVFFKMRLLSVHIVVRAVLQSVLGIVKGVFRWYQVCSACLPEVILSYAK